MPCMHYLNFYADQLATDEGHKSDHKDKSIYLHNIRESVLTATLDLIGSIENLLHESAEEKIHKPDGPSVTTDDLSAERSCRPVSSSYENPVT